MRRTDATYPGADDRPYAIWLRKSSCSQTRAYNRVAYWERFMERFFQESPPPPLKTKYCAWQGLGYYSRARNLHTAAKQIVDMGAFPVHLRPSNIWKAWRLYPQQPSARRHWTPLPPLTVMPIVCSRYYGIETPINSNEGRRNSPHWRNRFVDRPSSRFQPGDDGRCHAMHTSIASPPDLSIVRKLAKRHIIRAWPNDYPSNSRPKIKTRHLIYILRCQGGGGKSVCFHTASTPKIRIIFNINTSLPLFNDKPWSTFQLEITFSEFFFVLYLHPPPGCMNFFVIFW